jgi:DNA-binding NarL/FixJ family response regulator
VPDELQQGRDAFDKRAWRRAYEDLSAAEPVEVEDLERLAAAAYLVGLTTESLDVWSRAHRACADLGDIARAARCGFWIAFALLNNGDLAQGGGWVDRCHRLLDDRKLDCVERGYLSYADGLRTIFGGDVEGAHPLFVSAIGLGERFRDPELTALARIGDGRALIYLGEIDVGVALLDEAMVAVTTGEVSAIAVGDAYCTVIEGCHELFDVNRAREWTAALTHWCDAQPELVLYRGQCLIHRAEILQLRGAWGDAVSEAQRACDRLAQPPGQAALGAAEYLRADLHRLRGNQLEAEQAYQAASELGRPPQPGLALLRLDQGRLEAADAAIRRALDETQDPLARLRLLAPYIEIVLARADVVAARAGADELAGLAAAVPSAMTSALAAQALGAVLLAEGDPKAALVTLRRAWKGWQDLGAPYDAARARVLIALACRALDDADGARTELEAARSTFTALGAVPAVAAVDALAEKVLPPPGGLTMREVEVLALVAKGHTNRQIAERLVISEKTVASHLSHTFTKLGLASRAAATAYAYEHGLIR